MSANIEELTNDELRLRLLEYGFPNMPVTQTTRKVLVKKLKNAMENQKTKTRRETVAVIKSSDEEDIPEPKKREKTPNRRATIAVTEKTKKVPASSSSSESIPRSDTPVKASSRRSSRATPAKEQKAVVSSTEQIINEESDDDVVEVKTYTRRSKTPTMTKSETVRTSYKNPVETIVEPVIVPEKKRYVEEIPEPIQTTTRRKTYTSSVTTDRIELPQRTVTPTKFGKSSLTTSYNPTVTANYTYEKYDKYDKPVEKEIEFNEEDTPYLSNFAKRLSTLKAEPLNAGLNKPKYDDEDHDVEYKKPSYKEYPSTAYRLSSYTSPYQPPAKRSGVVNQMAKDFNSFDRKYSLRKYVYIALIVMLIIAIYVILFA